MEGIMRILWLSFIQKPSAVGADHVVDLGGNKGFFGFSFVLIIFWSILFNQLSKLDVSNVTADMLCPSQQNVPFTEFLLAIMIVMILLVVRVATSTIIHCPLVVIMRGLLATGTTVFQFCDIKIVKVKLPNGVLQEVIQRNDGREHADACGNAFDFYFFRAKL